MAPGQAYRTTTDTITLAVEHGGAFRLSCLVSEQDEATNHVYAEAHAVRVFVWCPPGAALVGDHCSCLTGLVSDDPSRIECRPAEGSEAGDALASIRALGCGCSTFDPSNLLLAALLVRHRRVGCGRVGRVA
jgi:hypothetical protein